MLNPGYALGISLLCLASVNAHFELYYPPTRGFNEDIENRFCGGFNTPNTRTPFPLTGGIVSLVSAHDTANFVTLVSFDANPENFGDFNTTSSGQHIPYLKPFLKINGAGDVCYPVDFQTLGLPDIPDGTNATIQIQYDGGDGNLYQVSCQCCIGWENFNCKHSF
ncbi:hypothetical protein FRC03_000613 [Tulasnella sp. 419]|nr:hypothetical protein FRC03_000613 [Tulasnella sp. 419]